ncbi:hypothetical protein HAX54_026949 [Datura stramonium]|uniref:Heterokaryon incompatibility domain-containing protein n=1 Tax=Datura stramonium TaxID=4076 RepID=A0ABS8S8D1_DATST|nr:hypothetical protein [Datura stramonium]
MTSSRKQNERKAPMVARSSLEVPRGAQQYLLKHSGRVDMIPCLAYVPVWGEEVSIALEDINCIYWADLVCLSLEYPRKLTNKDNQFAWVANIIA